MQFFSTCLLHPPHHLPSLYLSSEACSSALMSLTLLASLPSSTLRPLPLSLSSHSSLSSLLPLTQPSLCCMQTTAWFPAGSGRPLPLIVHRIGTCFCFKVVVVSCQDVFLPSPTLTLPLFSYSGNAPDQKFILSPQGSSLRGKYCYISLHSTTITPLTSLTPPTLTPTYTSVTLTTFSYLQIHPMSSSPALTTLLSLIPIILTVAQKNVSMFA